MKDLRAERSIRKQPRVTYEIALRAKTPTGGEILTRKAPARHGELPSSSPQCRTTPRECPAHTRTRPWLQSCSHTVCSILYKASTKLTSWSLFFSKKHGEAQEGAQPKPPCPQTPAYRHTHVHSRPRFLWLWESVRRKCGLGAAVMEVKTAALSELIQWQKERKGGRHRSLMRHL